jgi:hypothetical protein
VTQPKASTAYSRDNISNSHTSKTENMPHLAKRNVFRGMGPVHILWSVSEQSRHTYTLLQEQNFCNKNLDSSVLAHTFMAGIENTDCMLFCLEEVK